MRASLLGRAGRGVGGARGRGALRSGAPAGGERVGGAARLNSPQLFRFPNASIR